MHTLISDGGSMTVGRRTANYTWGAFEVVLPEGLEQQETEERLQDGYIYRPDDRGHGRAELTFVRADARIDMNAQRSDLEQTLDGASERTKGDAYYTRQISGVGLGKTTPGVDYRQGDMVRVKLWAKYLELPITAIIRGKSADGSAADVAAQVGGQMLRDAELLRKRNDDIDLQIAAEKRERLRQVGAVDKKATTAQEKADTADENAGKAQEKADTADENAGKAQSTADTAESKADAADGKAGQAQEKADAADEKAGQAQEKADALEIQLDPIMDFAQSFMPTGLGFNGSGRLPFRVQRGPAKGVGVENDGMRLLGAGAWQITCEVTASWVRVATRRIVYRVNCYNPQGDIYAYQEFIDDTSEESHTVAFGADFVVPEPNYFVAVHVNSVGIGRKHLGGWAATRLVAKRWSSEFINPPDGGAAETEPTP